MPCPPVCLTTRFLANELLLLGSTLLGSSSPRPSRNRSPAADPQGGGAEEGEEWTPRRWRSTTSSSKFVGVVTLLTMLKPGDVWLGVPLVFKSSFDKANRTSSKSFRGPGLEQGLKILEKVKAAYDLPVVTDVHESCQCEAVGRVADIIQIPAFLCRQTDLLVAAAKTGKIINIKKGQFCAPSVMANSAEKIRLAGNHNVMKITDLAISSFVFIAHTDDLIVDPRNFEWLRETNCPVRSIHFQVADVTHALQQPAGKKLDGGGVASGGLRELIPCIARTAVAVGVDGIFMEPLRNLEELLEELIAIAKRKTAYVTAFVYWYCFSW
ncbi:unnamed protein product [Triticum turgidum subsp. durum]|uniref:3-deoxy-8-phosphooctulonate synthase n=1 Tax=Triticum turgidum subsp. durum TaxID=4567 RepID=A0A9R1NJN1_TRITD|nr:unnamed protein product [Triticum turgidum subsp. durum]